MDPFASKLAFSAAAAGAAFLGALFPHPSYEAISPSRPWAHSGAANAFQPASGMADTYSYSGVLPADRGPIDVYGAHGWRLAREREILERQEAELMRAVAQAEGPDLPPLAARDDVPVAQPIDDASAVKVHRGSAPAEEVAVNPPEERTALAAASGG